MSTPSIGAETQQGFAHPHFGAIIYERARRALRGHEADPAWSRPLLLLVALLAGVLTLWGLTRNGYANTYYAEAAQAASRSWRAWLTNSVDASGSVSLDKGPLPNMLMGLSGRLLGFSSFSMLLPEALCGIGAVLLLHATVKRTLGPAQALAAALVLALTPIFVAMSRFNNPDALLVLLEVAAAWATVRALRSGRLAHVLLCAVFVGLAFNVKMLQVYLIVPGLALVLLIAGRGSIGRRLRQLLAGGAVMLVVSFAWYGAMMLIPAADRPWVGDTTDNSWFSLIFGANGLSRVSGEGNVVGPIGGASFGGAPGPLRLLNSIVGGQIGWLLPLALVGLVLGLWATRRAERTDPRRAAYVLWGAWGVVSWLVFSFSKGVFHPYYTTALAPAVAVLAGSAMVSLWALARHSIGWSVALAASFVVSAALAVVLLDRVSGLSTELVPVVVGCAVMAGCAALVSKLPVVGSGRLRVGLRTSAAGLGAVALLAGPAAYSFATVGRPLDGGNPLAGPAGALVGDGMPGGPSGATSGGGVPGGQLFGARGGGPGVRGSAVTPYGLAPPATSVAESKTLGSQRAGASGAGVSSALVSYLKAHQAGAVYLVAAVGSNTAGAIALRSGREVIDMGGFMGSDPAPSLTQLKHFISSGQLHYVLLGEAGAGSGAGAPAQAGSLPTPPGGMGLPGLGGSAVRTGRPVAGSGVNSAATQARDAWVRAHGRLVKLPGESTSTAGLELYYFA